MGPVKRGGVEASRIRYRVERVARMFGVRSVKQRAVRKDNADISRLALIEDSPASLLLDPSFSEIQAEKGRAGSRPIGSSKICCRSENINGVAIRASRMRGASVCSFTVVNQVCGLSFSEISNREGKRRYKQGRCFSQADSETRTTVGK